MYGPAAMSEAGDILGGKYQLIRLLGQGGMGKVFEAVNQNTDRVVAIKTLHPQWTREPAVVQRFLREARSATKIRHPNVVDVLDLDTDAATNAPYIVQEFLVGDALEDYLDARPEKHLGVEESLRLLVPVMSALVAAHELGIVHRDIKPANLFITRDRAGALTPKVIDFGIAKLIETHNDSVKQTQTGSLIGTPRYMSPEQAVGASDIDARTDVWSLGVVLYEMLTGAFPYHGNNHNVLVAKILYEEPISILMHDPGLPPDVVAVIDRALQKKPADRFPTMQAMLDATVACAAWSGASLPSLPSSSPRVSQPAAISSSPSSPSVVPVVVATPASTTSPSIVTSSGSPPVAPTRRGTMLVATVAVLVLAAIAGLAASRLTAPTAPVAASIPSPVHRSAEPAPTPVVLPTAPAAVVAAPTPPAPVAAAVATPVAAAVVNPMRPARAREPSPTPRAAHPTPPRPARRPTSAPADLDPGYPE